MRDRLSQFFARLKEFLQTNLYTILALVFVVVLTAAYVIFYVSAIDPGLTTRNQLEIQLDDARKQLLAARSIQQEPPESLQTRVADARATVSSAQNAFLTGDQSTRTIDLLYQYARASGITIIELQVPPTPTPLPTATWTPTRLPTPLPTATSLTRPAASQPSQAQPTPAQPIPPSATRLQGVPPQAAPYYVRPIRLRAQGTARQLVDFAARLKETNQRGIVVSNFNILGREETPTAILTMDLSLYVLPSSSDAVATRGAAPAPIPPVYPTPVIPTVTPIATLGVATVTVTPILLPTITSTPTPTPTPPSKQIVHVVQPGDTLFSLARRYGTTVEAIMALNRLPNTTIRVGQQLLIPVP
jgi:LysM repeat protein